jgi:hypothetical protein
MSYPRYFGHSVPISTEQPEIPHSIWYMGYMQCCHLRYFFNKQGAQFNEEDQFEARELDSNLLEEKHNKALGNMQKYQESIKRYYNKSIVPRDLEIKDLVLKKDIHTKDKHKFSSL